MERGLEVLLKEAEDAIAALNNVDHLRLTDGELADATITAHRLKASLDAACTHLTGAIDARKGWTHEGARSMSDWLTWKCHLRKGRAILEANNARALRHMPLVEEAFAAGEITAEHVRNFAHARAVNPDVFADDEDKLLFIAKTAFHRTFSDVLRYWRYRVAPNDEEKDARQRYEERFAYCAKLLDGVERIEAELPAVGGAIVGGELRRLERELFEADWAEAKERLDREPLPHELARTHRQRMADALVEMARRSAAKPADAKEPRTLATVLIGEETLARICQLANGTVLTPGEVLPLFCDCDIERVVFDGPSRVIDVGVRQRLFTGATRRAVEVRDRYCQHPSCDVPYPQCEIDHVEPHEAGGLTTQANGRVYCGYHNRWQYRMWKKYRSPPDD